MSAVDHKDQRRLCGVLGHELRNPLASAVANATVAAGMTDSADPRQEFLQRVVTDLGRLSTLLDSYLAWSVAGRVSRREVALAPLLRAAAGRCRVPVAVDAPDGDLDVAGDPELLSRAFENLLENAAAAGARSIEVLCVTECSDAVVYVSDDGPGVPHEVQERLFEPFVSGRGGSGLGLSVTRDVLEAHEGRIGLLPSESGARFRVALPLPW